MAASSPKPPRRLFETIFAFAPNRDTQGGTAYFILDHANPEDPAHILVDAPPWDQTTQDFLTTQGGVRWLFITHRGGLGQAAKIQRTLGCEVVIQEQEAYLLPQTPTTPFHQSFCFNPQTEAFWTPGHSPGSACLYHNAYGGLLFTGRHLLPDQHGHPRPLRLAKTFHWPRQLAQVDALKHRFSEATLAHLCPGANLGFLRGRPTIAEAYQQLQRIPDHPAP
jgi:glyoxylase-like metal-dependent hydrolase (beta-lactamase superfamily II)